MLFKILDVSARNQPIFICPNGLPSDIFIVFGAYNFGCCVHCTGNNISVFNAFRSGSVGKLDYCVHSPYAIHTTAALLLMLLTVLHISKVLSGWQKIG
jgi:hypothetical protein